MGDNPQLVMINSHASELLHTCPIKLKKNESVVMMCNWGCPLGIGRLFREFIYKHIAKSMYTDQLIKLLLNPTSKGKKYRQLYFINRLFCLYKDHIPDMELDFKYDPYFRSGVHELPVKTDKRVEWSKVANPDDFTFNFESEYYRPIDVIRLSKLIKRMRRDYPQGFTLIIFTCRGFKSDIENIPIKQIKLNKK